MIWNALGIAENKWDAHGTPPPQAINYGKHITGEWKANTIISISSVLWKLKWKLQTENIVAIKSRNKSSKKIEDLFFLPE